MVINSVHGADKAIQLSSLYKDFTTASGSDKNSSRNFQTQKNSSGDVTLSNIIQNDHPNPNQDLNAKISHPNLSTSHESSSCSQTSVSSLSSSSGAKHCTVTAETRTRQESIIEGKVIDIPYKENCQMDMILSNQTTQLSPDRFYNKKSLGEHCSSRSLSPSDKNKSRWMSVKATYGAEKVRIRLYPSSSFDELRQEILKRFSIGTQNSVNLRYLDDESEWVLLTCDADLQECIQISRSSGAQTIKISVQPVGTLTRASSWGTGLSMIKNPT